ncbi:hypothetical protein CUMW_236380 [Citrus unshiu]|uniref:Protein kinase domain-containing protein n=1 Tax=Citrus unshiu TaxID=55188 RepID=A0A2H5QJK8_CITUN|nr:hypothetical protein CUMW_236380 [Citrus unshiu]
MVAHLSDFGTGRLLTRDQSMTQTETLGRLVMWHQKPTDEMFTTDISLKRWVNNLLPTSLMEVVDKTLLSREEEDFVVEEQCVLLILSFAMECVIEMPEKRIDAKDIITKLLKIKDILVKDHAKES